MVENPRDEDAGVRADDGNGHGQNGDHRGPETLQKKEHHQDDQGHGFKEGVHHLFDGGLGKQAGIQDHLVIKAGREAGAEFLQQLTDFLRSRDGVGPGLLIDHDGHGPFAVHLAGDGIVFPAQLGVAYVLQADDGRPLLAGAQDDVVEIPGLGQQALGGDHEGLLGTLGGGGLADSAHPVGLVLLSGWRS